MLKVHCPDLPLGLQAYLDEKCAHESPWNSLRRSKDASRIKELLSDAFHGKCGYCEQIEAHTVDHFWPQADPAQRWIWQNFVLACSVCQSKKLDRLPVDDDGHQMVDPRLDEPLAFLYFEYDTGIVEPLPISEEGAARGRVTIERLALDHRPMLSKARRRKFWRIISESWGASFVVTALAVEKTAEAVTTNLTAPEY